MSLDYLAALLASAGPPPAGGERHQVLFTPAFHLEVLLIVDLLPDAAAVHLRVFAGSLWEALACNPELRDRTPAELVELVELALPPHTDHRAVVGPERAARLRHDLARDLPGLAVKDDRQGRDGIDLQVAVTGGDAPMRRFHAWSPTPDHPAHAYFATMQRLAVEVLDDPARAYLDPLHDYLDLGPPLRDEGGAPRRLGIFGRLHVTHARALAALLGAPREDEPVLVDMQTLECMDNELYPRIKKFSTRAGPIVWVASNLARRQLRAAGVPERQLHHDVADALLHLATLAWTPARR